MIKTEFENIYCCNFLLEGSVTTMMY